MNPVTNIKVKVISNYWVIITKDKDNLTELGKKTWVDVNIVIIIIIQITIIAFPIKNRKFHFF